MEAGNIGVRSDPFVSNLLKKIPAAERSSFTDDQLMALKSALSARAWGAHAVDLRWTLKIWRRRFYFVFLSGVNKRDLSRTERELARRGKALLLAGFITFSILMGLLVLYLVKSALGIDLIPGFSLGIWGWFKGLF
ncbi:MAG: 3-phosphoshikimate 1-carboxyvinyltransferase [Gammaproteobacteria bacterium]|nr:3-phosphoshikimate 1-carboxyvinyltransferase [Gammaproteobacteria bacterium]